MTRATKVQADVLAVLKQGYPAAIDRSPVFRWSFSSRHHGTEANWLWVKHNTITSMLKHGWIEWRLASAGKRAGYYLTEAGREALPQ